LRPICRESVKKNASNPPSGAPFQINRNGGNAWRAIIAQAFGLPRAGLSDAMVAAPGTLKPLSPARPGDPQPFLRRPHRMPRRPASRAPGLQPRPRIGVRLSRSELIVTSRARDRGVFIRIARTSSAAATDCAPASSHEAADIGRRKRSADVIWYFHPVPAERYRRREPRPRRSCRGWTRRTACPGRRGADAITSGRPGYNGGDFGPALPLAATITMPWRRPPIPRSIKYPSDRQSSY